MLKWLVIPLWLFAMLSGLALAQNIAEERANAPRRLNLCPRHRLARCTSAAVRCSTASPMNSS